MAARKQLWHDASTREKIQVSQLINRLRAHGNGTLELSATQVRAIEILLRKCLPDLAAVEHTGPDGGALTVEVVRFAPAPALDLVAEPVRHARDTLIEHKPIQPLSEGATDI